MGFVMFSDNKIIGNCKVYNGDCSTLIEQLPSESIDIIITSPPYWGQRTSSGIGVEEDPRVYISNLVSIFTKSKRVLKKHGLLWLNIGDAYNTPINWSDKDYVYSTLGANKKGLSPDNSAYKKNREKRKAFVRNDCAWLKYGNLLAIPYRIVIDLVDSGFYYRGEVIWKKLNPMPEGLCRRPHRIHEPIYLMSKSEDHLFTTKPPIKSIWEFPNEGRKEKTPHFSRFPEELPRKCILSSGVPLNEETIILDPFAGSGTTGVVAKQLGCSFIGFEIDPNHSHSANERIADSIVQPYLITNVI